MTLDDILKALKSVQDPELRCSIVDLGMVRDVLDDDDRIGATIVLTTAGCPLQTRIRADAESALAPLANGRAVQITLAAMASDERDALKKRLAQSSAPAQTLFGPGSHTHVVAIASGKGGVGKSTVTANLAVALAGQGYAVALIDADVYGPTMPLMLGLPSRAPSTQDGRLLPPEAHGVKVVSMGLFIPEDEPVVWRGPMLTRAVEQFLGDVAWGSPDFLLIDLPPGTGDVALTIAQILPQAALIVVTTPQDVASKTAVKAAKMAQMTRQRIVGVIENMAYYVCPECHSRHEIFGRGGGAEIARLMGTQLLGQIPLDEHARITGDQGRPIALDLSSSTGSAFVQLAMAVVTAVSSPPGPEETRT